MVIVMIKLQYKNIMELSLFNPTSSWKYKKNITYPQYNKWSTIWMH